MATFQFTVTAPATTGSYVFQWQMVQDGVAWFGEKTPPVTVSVITPAEAALPVNLVLGRAANQTTALTGDFAEDAHKAVDGNTNGNYAAGSVTHTKDYFQPFWEVPLSNPSVVKQVDIWNRTDCCSERLSNFYVFVSRDYVMSNDPVTASHQAGVWTYYVAGPAPAHLTIPVPSVQASWIRIELAGQGVLSMAEVQVWNAPIATLTNTTQSSTSTGVTPAGDAFRAADGSRDGSYTAGSVTHTNAEVQPWWQADLGASTPIEHIDVWNRTDCCGERLADFYLFVSDVPFSSPSLSATLSQPGVSAYFRPGPAGQITPVRVNRYGRYVRVQLAGAAPGVLSLAEVQVFSGTVTWPPAVSITSPYTSQIFASPATIPLRAAVSGGSGNKTVQYYNGATMIGSSSTGPTYMFDWAGVGIGGYTISAKVVDANSDTAESLPVSISVRVPNDAAFASQSVPSTMTTGQTYSVIVGMKNTGGATWTTAAGYSLGSAGPQDNSTWGLVRVPLPSSIPPDGQAFFQFSVKAPSTPGDYNFQWRMVQDGVAWFGSMSAPVTVSVTVPANPVPAITGITPPARTAGSGTFTLTVDGSNFVSASTVAFNGASRGTAFVSSTRLTATMLASDVQTAGTYSITVVNPTPGGGVSNAAALTVNAPPSVVISSPSNNQIFAAPATVPLSASVGGSTSGGTVQYYNGATLIGSGSGPSNTFNWTNVAASVYTIKAKVVDANGDTAESSPVTFSVRVPNDAAFVSQTVPATMTAGQTYAVTVVMKNTGAATWTTAAGYNLGSSGPQDNSTWSLSRVPLPTSVAPDGQASFQFSVKAPSAAGSYNFQWRMVQDGVAWFG
ncbi:MAG TPA: NBR1-Ig-like domain-containing protein, partial [Thermoanaerobaculia bacterium]|nr:NBR1-Ig-like domain-containing protein [Thermoanaerobaculia bacterium]